MHEAAIWQQQNHKQSQFGILLHWQVRDARGRRVGRCKEWTKVVGVDQVDARVLAMRHKDQLQEPKVQKTIKPERVMTYRLASYASEDVNTVAMTG